MGGETLFFGRRTLSHLWLRRRDLPQPEAYEGDRPYGSAVGLDGQPQVIPVTFWFNAEEDTIDIGGISFADGFFWIQPRRIVSWGLEDEGEELQSVASFPNARSVR